MHVWQLREHTLEIRERALILGIVNVTPDSFSDGGKFMRAENAVAQGLELVRQGADLLDLGGESTRPGAEPVDAAEEIRRVLPVVQKLVRQTSVPLSIDTSKADVARQCLHAGAHVINDVTGLTGDPAMVEVAKEYASGLIVMHMQGTPQTMQAAPHYDDVVLEISQWLEARLDDLSGRGISPEKIALDPGIGFGKTREHNMELLARLAEFQRLGRPLCLGVSRKGLIGKVLNRAPEERIIGSIAIACFALAHGAAQILRVHDVKETRDAVEMCAALTRAPV